MPNSSNYKGYCFWHPAKLVRTSLIGNGYFKSFGYTEEFEFKLRKFDKERNLVDEIIIDYLEMEEAFEVVSNTISGNIEAAKQADERFDTVRRPAKIENTEVKIDEDLLV